MIIVFGTTLMVAAALLFDLVGPTLLKRVSTYRAGRRRLQGVLVPDPGREQRAEQRARELLRSCVNDEEWRMYRDLGFIRVWSRLASSGRGGEVAYLIYPHQPVVSFAASTSVPMHEYCVVFPDDAAPGSIERLPNSDDVLAKWMALTGDEGHFLTTANEHAAGRQVAADQIRRDLWRLSRWEGSRQQSGPHGDDAAPLIAD